MKKLLLGAIVLAAMSGPALADCTGPAAVAGTWDYLGAPDNTFKFCNGTSWIDAGAPAGGGAGYLQFSDGAGNLAYSGTTAGQQLFWDNTAKRLGIGTSTPGAPLEVKDGTASMMLTGASVLFTRNDANYIWGNTAGGYLAFGGNGLPTMVSNANFYTGSASQDVIFNGSIGVGEPAPADTVHIKVPTSDKGLRIVDTGTGSGIQFQGYQPSVNMNSFWDGTASSYRAIGNGYTGAVTFDVNTGEMKFSTGPNPGAGQTLSLSTKVRIANDGKVTISPGNGTLGLRGQLRMRGTFASGTSDTGARIVADIYSGFSTGAWGNEYLAIGVGTGGANDGDANTTERLRITSAGNLTITGSTATKASGTTWAVSSDRRLKNVDGPYLSGLDAVAALKPVRFHYKPDNIRGLPSDKENVGLIAQEVRPLFPEAVIEGKDGYLTLDSSPINFAVINAIRELKTRVDDLKAANAALTGEVEALKAGEAKP